MNKIVDALENSKNEEAITFLTNQPSLLTEKTDDGWNTLQLASYYNNNEVIDYCLKNLTYEEINNHKTHPLLIAIEEKNENAINAFLNFKEQDKINWAIKEKNGDNLVSLAVYYQLDKIIEPLLNKGISCFELNSQNKNAFSLVVEKGDINLYDKLDEHNNIIDNYEETLIKKSIQHDHIEIFERLQPYTQLSPDELFNLSAGFNSIKIMNNIMESGEIIPGMNQITKIVDLMCKKYENPEDSEAAKNLAQFLFDVKIPFNRFVNDQGQSAWMLCIQNNNNEVFEKLMNSSENVNILDSEQHSPLFYAIEKNNTHFVSLLLKKKANPNQLDKHKNNPLIKAVEKGNIEMVKEILKYYPMVNETNSTNEHALSIAIKKKRMDIVSELIWAGGEITTNPVKFIEEKHIFHFGANGETERFAYHDEEEINNFVALSKLGFKLNQTNEDGDTFLLHFIKNGYMSNFTALLRCQFNPNEIDNDGNNALMCSAMKNQDLYFNAITNKFNNLDLTQVNNNNENIYDICLKYNKVDRIEKLLILDNNLSEQNAIKAAKIIAKDGNLEANIEKLKKSGLDFSFIDENKNNLIMFSLVGGNLDNFKYLIETVGVPIDLTHKNKFGHTIEDIINAMPTEIGKDFNSYLNKSKKKP